MVLSKAEQRYFLKIQSEMFAVYHGQFQQRHVLASVGYPLFNVPAGELELAGNISSANDGISPPLVTNEQRDGP